MRHLLSAMGAAALAIGLLASPAEASTLDQVKARGTLRCGVVPDLPGLSVLDSRGEWQGFHADICRAIAAAVLQDARKVTFVALTLQARFTALQSGEVDLLETPTALSVTRDLTLGLTTPVMTMMTGQAVMVSTRLNVTGVKQLDGATVCAIQGSEIERNLQDYGTSQGITFRTVAYDTATTLLTALSAGRCDAVSNDVFSLPGYRESLPDRANWRILPELVAKEPHGIMVRGDDLAWASLMRWAVFALIQAEELGITRGNLEQRAATAGDEKARRFLEGLASNGRDFGLQRGWTGRAVAASGNYGEIYERHLGHGGLQLDRGPNRLWTDGGMLASWLWQ